MGRSILLRADTDHYPAGSFAPLEKAVGTLAIFK
jgi:hypothetical protein